MTTRKTTKKAASQAPAATTTGSGSTAKRSTSAAKMHDIFSPTAPDNPPVVEPAPPAPAGAESAEPGGAPRQGPDQASWALAEHFRHEGPEAAAAREAAARSGIVPVAPGVATMLTFLARTARARSVVEIGSGTGVSGLALFAGMAGDGVLTSIDSDPEAQRVARGVFRDAGIPSNRFRLITGDALSVMPKLSDAAYDLVFVDGDKLEYAEYIEQAQRLLRAGGVLVVNNALWNNLVADPANDDNETIVIREALEAVTTMETAWIPALLPVGNGLLVASRADD
ncbi:Predicted O-methyltransferase YrrM [Raineyella antarctica]|uniref:Predicted O-methyltransferase YrrM n=1 Tax=Raineyella antarctica TaxID=1577474 RepID=A0A1G6GDS2_9ACTN|nr:O-methyltransferase [Raineyella antarctica]SDB80059.1 Predicted O-methyltransferase YrrM [Raineyella antarctica]